MRHAPTTQTLPISLLAPHSGHIGRTLIALAIIAAVLNILEALSIVFMDSWLPVASMEQAEWYSIAISAFAEAVRISLLGIAIHFAMRPLAMTVANPMSAVRFVGFWIGCAGILGLALLGMDTIGYFLQFGTMPMDGEAFRTAFLMLIYAKILIYYLGLRLLFGAGGFVSAKGNGFSAAWKATTLSRSLSIGVGYLALWLAVEGVITPILSYTPAIAPFWFIPDQTAPYRFLVGQGTRILAEAIAIVLYALVWMVAFGGTIVSAPADAAAAEV
ncbi:hypothetical protein PSQ19_05215 [Devosia algicola]|uniref:Uncharacterized protein n=1 Tax=Devosia algicola TaxID=3026418 RepID=A0ABY7YQG7_9HYPH|nr:hypothetical protein [Devosia algicola]WDR03499.1 hypothetical protein PSQ19_05215 [Devosia algicola]